MRAIVSLIGQQPLPNLLPVLYLKPDLVCLVYSDFTASVQGKLAKLLSGLPWRPQVRSIQVEAYPIEEIQAALRKEVLEIEAQAEELLFNLTGGTKPMSIAAFRAAEEMKSRFIYLQTQGKQTLLHTYHFEGRRIAPEKEILLPALIRIDDYLKAHVESYEATGFANEAAGGMFERAIHAALAPVVDEILAGVKLLGALDVDFVVRCDNQVGVIEAKTGGGMKKGLDQLNTAGGQEYLGTYVQKFLVSDQRWDHTRSNLRELAEARRITLIELPGYRDTGTINPQDRQTLQTAVCEALGRRRQHDRD